MNKILLIFFAACFSVLNGQAPSKFYTRFGGNGHDIGYGVIQTLDGHYAVTGSTGSFGFGNSDVYLAKVDSMGWVRWEKSFGGFNNDVGRSIIQTADSGFVIGGYTNSMGNGGYDLYILKTDKNGTLIWQKTFGGLDWDFGYCVRESSDGGFVVCGTTESLGYGKTDGYIVKVNASGAIQWEKTYGGAEDDEFKSFVFTYNNLIAFTGTNKSLGDVKGDAWIMKTDLNGDSVLNINYSKPNKQFINDMVEAANGDYVLVGATDINGQDSTIGYVLSLDENGIYKYDNNFPRTEKYKDYQFSTVANGKYLNNYFFVYKTWDAPVNHAIEPLYMLSNAQWPYAYTTCGSLSNEEIFDCSKTRDKGYVCIGYTNGFGSNLNDLYLVKLDSTIITPPSVVGVEDKSHNASVVNIFPTLVTDKIHVTLPSSVNDMKVNLISSEGALVYEGLVSEANSTIDLSGLRPGFYIITLQNSSYVKSFKIIKV